MTLPDDVRDNKHLRRYIKYNKNNEIVTIFERVPDSRDTSEVVTTITPGIVPCMTTQSQRTLPVYFGEWQETPKAEIKRLNDEIDAKRLLHHKKYDRATLEKKIAAAKLKLEALLAAQV